MVKFGVLVRRIQDKKNDHKLVFKRSDFDLFTNWLGRILWHEVLERRGIQESSLVFEDHLLSVQEGSILTSRKSSTGSRRPAWMSKSSLYRR